MTSTLVVISPLRGFETRAGALTLTRKFVDGMNLYKELWKGPVLLFCEPSDGVSDNLDNCEVDKTASSFEIICAPLTANLLKRCIPKDSVVLTSVGERFNFVASVCKEIKVPCIYVAEYTLTTRRQIIMESAKSITKKAWSIARQVQQEIAQRRAIKFADGVQCNGLPTYDAYRSINSNPHVYFDTRVTSDMFAELDDIVQKSHSHRMGRKLHIVFSGRLIPMKGVDDLILVANELRHRLADRFQMSICGDGTLKTSLQAEIDNRKLGDVVRLVGTLDFRQELVPFLKKEADVFLCCHRQGDPSCTYLETMACGVPVLGYANEAWLSLSKASQSGWTREMGDYRGLANVLADLDKSENLIEAAAIKSLEFAKQHSFEKTFIRRVDHMRNVLHDHNRRSVA